MSWAANVGLIAQFAHGEEAVESPRKRPVGDGDAGISQPIGVRLAFILKCQHLLPLSARTFLKMALRRNTKFGIEM